MPPGDYSYITGMMNVPVFAVRQLPTRAVNPRYVTESVDCCISRAGHAVAAHKLGYRIDLVTIKLRPGLSEGLTKYPSPIARMNEFTISEDRNRWRVEHVVIVTLAGTLALRASATPRRSEPKSWARSNWP